ncbi:MAG: serine hydrolase, partial [Candidatus Rokubacteria bacterium]|nr:serine hydrolase [Candidatus Rokubacteria bacterium]
MRPALLVIAFLLSSALVAPAAAADFSAVDTAVSDAVASGDVPGAVVLVGRGDEVLLDRAWGLRATVPERAPMTTDTIFDIASLTKPLGTALAVMSLVERGHVTLDAPLGRYLREFRGRDFDQVTIRRILTHSAGFPAIPPTEAVAGGFPGAARALATKRLDYPPGTGFQYSDTGFILLGELVRRVSGEPLDRYLARILFRPLGLRDTTFHPSPAQRALVAPTEYANGHLLRGEVHDPRARLLGGVAGHAGMFSTAADLARICRMLLRGGELDGHRVLRASTVRLMWTRTPEDDGLRALGWDMSSPFARTLAPFFPSGSVGHTGFTGTAVWLDPASQTYVILLTNRVHPSGGGAARIRELRTRVAAAVGAAQFLAPAPLPPPAAAPAADGAETGADAAAGAGAPRPAGGVRAGIDVLVERRFAPLRGHAVGLVTNHTGVDSRGRRTIDLLASAAGVRLQAIFTPEHGLGGAATADVSHGRDAVTGRPVWSLYGPTRRPTPEMLQGVSLLVYDVQDVGVRYYTYLTTLVYAMEEAAKYGIPLVVLDRPNP